MTPEQLRTFYDSVLDRLRQMAGAAWVEPLKGVFTLRAKFRGENTILLWELRLTFPSLVMVVSRSFGAEVDRISTQVRGGR